MQTKGRILVAAVVIVALLAGGFVTGAQWQKVQPVDINIDWYSAGNDTAYFDTYTLTEKGMVEIYPDRNVTYYGVLKNH